MKQEAFANHKEVSYTVAAYTLSILEKENASDEDLKDHFIEHMEVVYMKQTEDYVILRCCFFSDIAMGEPE